jgi:hypothetical protein
MSKKGKKPPTYAEIIGDILHPFSDPIPIDDLIDQVQAIRPSKAKKPRQAIRSKIREEEGRLLVCPEASLVMPLRLAFQGARFRKSLDREMIKTGLLDVEIIFHSYLPLNFPLEGLQFIDLAGHPIPFQLKQEPQQIETIFGLQEKIISQLDIKRWFHSQKMYHKDHILVTCQDWEKGLFRLERESASARNKELVEARNRQLADIFFNLLEEATSEKLYERAAVPTAYALLPDKDGYPPDHWMIVIDEDARMTYDGWQIGYSDGILSPIEIILRQTSGKRVSAPPQAFSRVEGQQVYRFNAAFKHDAKIWREIEIQGKQTLFELDRALRSAFEHDFFDHLSGFWKLVQRGGSKRKRYREVDLGSLNPYDGGEGADTQIAGLGLQVGDRLKYVYDFGDWVEHILTLRAINNPEKGEEYPREVSRNKPRFLNCVSCQEKEKDSIARWICLTCSNIEQTEIVLCEDCADQHDEDHYLDEILY